MSSKGKKYKKMVRQVKFHEILGCANPDVRSGMMSCDGDCNTCQYSYVSEVIKEF